jgi:hypothetical protein
MKKYKATFIVNEDKGAYVIECALKSDAKIIDIPKIALANMDIEQRDIIEKFCHHIRITTEND